MTEVMTLNTGSFAMLSCDEMFAVDGGINWDRIFGGVTVYLGATMALLAITSPIGWGMGAAYLATCACSGAYIGYGFAT